MGLAFSLQRQSCSLWWTASNPALFPFFSWRRNLFAALRLWLVSSPTENRFSNFVIQVTTYQKQYFYTDSLESATEFVRAIADDIKRPFSVRFFAIAIGITFTFFCLRYNPYTQTVEVLNNSDKILDVAKELKGDLAIVASALRKVQKERGTKTRQIIKEISGKCRRGTEISILPLFLLSSLLALTSRRMGRGCDYNDT